MYRKYRYSELEVKSQEIGILFDVMVVGVTGAGKSTTLNSFFKKEVAAVGRGVDPQTMSLDCYSLNDLFRFWDTPGLGDGKKKDGEHAKLLKYLLHKNYGEKNGWIDLVLVIIEGSNRDLGTSYKILNEIVIPNFQADRVLVAINQADMAMKGRYWNQYENKPMEQLEVFLEEQACSIQRRVKEATGMDIIKPIYYSAEYGFNIDKLLDLIIDNIPLERRRIKNISLNT